MFNFLSSIELIFRKYPIITIISGLSFIIKIYIISLLLFPQNNSKTLFKNARIYLYLIILGGMFEDLGWILSSIKFLYLKEFNFITIAITVISRASWLLYVIEFQSFALLLENLANPTSKLNIRQQLFIFITLCFLPPFLYITFSSEITVTTLQAVLEKVFPLYAITLLMPISIYYSFKQLKITNAPRILNKQFRVLVQYLIIPRMVSDFIQYYPFIPAYDVFSANTLSSTTISTISLTIMLYFCVKKIIGLRFLNVRTHVQQVHRYSFVDNFTLTLEEFARATNTKELTHVTQTFFKKAFEIPLKQTSLYIRASNPIEGISYKIELSHFETLTETFITTASSELDAHIRKSKILIYDEIEFNNFYDPNPCDQAILRFMETINADIFLPVYQNGQMISYIIVERYARKEEFYSHTETNEMLVFANYLSNIIHLLQNRNLEVILYKEKELKEELYRKHQEINQYKESIYSFLKNSKHKNIGIIFYKNRHFVFANQIAKEIIKINPNTHQGSSLTKAMKSIALQVEEYKTAQSCIAKTENGERIVINGVPNLEKNHVIITVCYPDFADLISSQLSNLKDPSMWDYLLYLETTKPGQFINQLIPGSGEQLLHFKINLLQIALSKKAILLEVPTEDVISTAELIHHISMRTTLQIITLNAPIKGYDIPIKLFGINPVFGSNPENSKPLLEKLDNTGTLFIQNIEFLDLETQEYLAEFIKYGYFRIFKSTQKITSSTRIIVSTNQNLSVLTQEGSFSATLFAELKKASIVMPSLLTLPDHELNDLVEGFAEQATKNHDLKNILDLNPRERNKIFQHKPSSLSQLKNRIHHLLEQKSKETNIQKETYFDPSYDVSDPDLIHAARLGKHALRDQQIMVMLWNKFKNQNKIASFLGVNRSSVNRRCKEYKLI